MNGNLEHSLQSCGIKNRASQITETISGGQFKLTKTPKQAYT